MIYANLIIKPHIYISIYITLIYIYTIKLKFQIKYSSIVQAYHLAHLYANFLFHHNKYLNLYTNTDIHTAYIIHRMNCTIIIDITIITIYMQNSNNNCTKTSVTTTYTSYNHHHHIYLGGNALKFINEVNEFN